MAFHVGLGVRDSTQLILRLLEGKHFLKLPLPYRVFSKGIAFTLLAHRIQLHEILCHGADRTADLGLGMFPFLATQLIQLRLLRRIGGGVFLDHIQSGSENVQIATVPVLDLQVVLDNVFHLYLLDAFVYPQSMSLMHHIITDLQVIEIVDLLPLVEFFLFLLTFLRPENITLGQHYEFQPWVFESFIYMTVIGQDLSGLYFPHGVFRIYCRESRTAVFRIPQILCQTSCASTGAGQ